MRAGDFLSPSGGSWFCAVVVKPGVPLKKVTYPGTPNVGHAWAYLPDLAETIARLSEREKELDPFEVFHFGGYWLDPGIEICEAVRRAAGKPDLPIRGFPWILVYAASPFVAFMRELIEMRYCGASRFASTTRSSSMCLAANQRRRSTTPSSRRSAA